VAVRVRERDRVTHGLLGDALNSRVDRELQRRQRAKVAELQRRVIGFGLLPECQRPILSAVTPPGRLGP